MRPVVIIDRGELESIASLDSGDSSLEGQINLYNVWVCGGEVDYDPVLRACDILRSSLLWDRDEGTDFCSKP
jgi:hypothetical protein